MARSEPARNLSHLSCSAPFVSKPRTSESEAAQEWLKPLPPTFSCHRAGLVEHLYSSVLQLFQMIRPGLSEQHENAIEVQEKHLRLWKDDKTDIEDTLNRNPSLKAPVVLNLADLALVLSKGVDICLPAQKHAFEDVHRMIDQASQILREDLGLPKDYLSYAPIDFSKFMIDRITARVGNLRSLSQTLDRSSGHLEGIKPPCTESRSTSPDSASFPFMLELTELFPYASKTLLKRFAHANWRRLLALWPCSQVPPLGRKTVSISSTDSCSFDTEDPSIGYPPQVACRLCDIGKSEQGFSIVDWREHALAHLNPHICSFSECKEGLFFFKNRKDWVEHEFDVHRVKYEWKCDSCQSSFHQRNLFMSHTNESHPSGGLLQSTEEVLERSEVKLSRPAQDEQCPFCGNQFFVNMEDFANHVGDHMQQIAGLVIPFYRSTIEPERLASKDESLQTIFTAVVQSLLSSLFRATLHLIKPDNTFNSAYEHPVKIYNRLTGKYEVYKALFDSGSQLNYMTHSIANYLGHRIETSSEAPLAEGVNGQKISCTQYVVPEWAVDNKQCSQTFKAAPFWLVEYLPNGVLIIGSEFLEEHRVMSVNLRALVIHSGSSEKPNVAEQERRNHQAEELKSKRAERNAAIKAKRNSTAGLSTKNEVAHGKEGSKMR